MSKYDNLSGEFPGSAEPLDETTVIRDGDAVVVFGGLSAVIVRGGVGADLIDPTDKFREKGFRRDLSYYCDDKFSRKASYEQLSSEDNQFPKSYDLNESNYKLPLPQAIPPLHLTADIYSRPLIQRIADDK